MKTEMTTQSISEKLKLKIIPLTLVIGGVALAGTGAFLFFSSTFNPVSKQSVVKPTPTVESLTTSLKKKALSFSTVSLAAQPQAALELKALAQQRKPLMAALLGTHPGKFAQVSLTEEEFQQLPTDVQGLVERRVRVTGKLNILHEDFFDDNHSTDTLSLDIDGVLHPLYLTSLRPDNTRSGSTLEVSGWQLDDVLLAVGPTDQSPTDESGITVVEAAASTAVTGDQKTLVVLVHSDELSVPNLQPTAVGNVMFTATNSVNQFYQKNSFGSVSLSGTVRGWYALDVPASTCHSNLAVPALDAVYANDPTIALNSYQHLAIVFKCTGAGAVGGTYTRQTFIGDYGTITLDVETVQSAFFIHKFIAHEFGHAFGADHASYRNCYGFTDPGGASVSVDPRCPVNVYRDPFDTMGNINYGHLNAPHKIASGWLAAQNFLTVVPADIGPEGYADFTIEPIESDSSPGIPGTTGLKVIRIQRGTGDYLYVEYRQPLDVFDAALPNAGYENNVFGGALLHILYGGAHTLLIDATPDSTATDGNYTPTLPLSDPVSPMVFTDPASRVQIEVVGKTASLLTVRVRFIPDTTPPTVTITSPQNNPLVYQNVFVTGQVVDEIYIDRVEFYFDNAASPMLTTTNSTLSNNIPTSTLTEGPHTLTVKAVDGRGNVGTSAAVPFHVDNTPPSVAVIQPQPNATVSGVYQIRVNAQDSQGVKKVTVELDGNSMQPLFVDTVNCLIIQPCPPYVFDWNTATTANRTHTLRVVAQNQAGAYTFSPFIQVNVLNIGTGGGGIDPIETQ